MNSNIQQSIAHQTVYPFAVALTWFLLVLVSCGTENLDPDSSSPGFESDPEGTCLLVVDSIGVEIGDPNYVFGAIGDVGIGPGGDIFVVDKMKCCIFRYSPDGEFIQLIGRRGEGPGEMLQPGFVALMDDGSIAIYDGELGWQRYDSNGVSTGSRGLLNPFPMRMISVDSTMILGMLSGLDREDNNFIVEKRICVWSADRPDSVLTEFFSCEYLLDAVDIDQFRKDIVRVDFFPMFAAAGDNFVCVAPAPRTDPVLLLFHEDGSAMDTLTFPYPEVERTEEELQEQKQFIEVFFYSSSKNTHRVDWEPFPNKPMITALGVDSLNRIWVQRGFEQDPTFDLYSLSGELLMTAVLPGRNDTAHWRFSISGNGVLAVPEDPESYYSVYIIELQE